MKYLSFKQFVKNYGLKNEGTCSVKIKEILNEIDVRVASPAGMYMRDDKFTKDSGIANLHPTKGTIWVMFVDEFYFDSYGCAPPTNILNHIKNGIYSEYQIQKNDIVIVQRIVYMFYISHKLKALKMQFQIFTIKFSNLINEES